MAISESKMPAFTKKSNLNWPQKEKSCNPRSNIVSRAIVDYISYKTKLTIR